MGCVDEAWIFSKHTQIKIDSAQYIIYCALYICRTLLRDLQSIRNAVLRNNELFLRHIDRYIDKITNAKAPRHFYRNRFVTTINVIELCG